MRTGACHCTCPCLFLLMSGNFVHQQMKVFRNEPSALQGASKPMFSHTEFTEYTDIHFWCKNERAS